MPLPLVSIIGCPNVGKSTLFNRLIGHRRAIVHEKAGTTRDLLEGECSWRGMRFQLLDTGGYDEADREVFGEPIRKKVREAIRNADLVLLTLDVRTGLTATDHQLVTMVRKSGKPTILLANKSEESMEAPLEWYRLGLDPIVPISGLTGRGSGDLMDLIVERLKGKGGVPAEEGQGIRVAIVGVPNVGKSSLVNRLLGEEKAIVTDVPGTTRDAVDAEVMWNRQRFILIDTAGLRKRSRISEDVEYFSRQRTLKVIGRADVAVVLLDVERGFGRQDRWIISHVLDQGRGLLLVASKWDLASGLALTKEQCRKAIYHLYHALDGYPVLFASSKTGEGMGRLLSECKNVYKRWTRAVPTPKLNIALQQAVEEIQPPSIRGKHIRIKYAVQTGHSPPAFSLFSTYPQLVPENYRNYLENQFRSAFDFRGVPIRISFKRSP